MLSLGKATMHGIRDCTRSTSPREKNDRVVGVVHVEHRRGFHPLQLLERDLLALSLF